MACVATAGPTTAPLVVNAEHGVRCLVKLLVVSVVGGSLAGGVAYTIVSCGRKTSLAPFVPQVAVPSDESGCCLQRMKGGTRPFPTPQVFGGWGPSPPPKTWQASTTGWVDKLGAESDPFPLRK